MNKKGFTLIEILSVIAIIAILAGIVFPMIGGSRERAMATQSLSNLRSIGQALQLYAQDNRMILPAAASDGNDSGIMWSGEIHPYLAHNEFTGYGNLHEALYCPVYKNSDDYNPAQPWRTGYGMNYRLYRPSEMGATQTRYSLLRINEESRGQPVVVVGSAPDWHLNFQRFSNYFNTDRESLTRYSGKGHYLFLDGSVEAMSPQEAQTRAL